MAKTTAEKYKQRQLNKEFGYDRHCAHCGNWFLLPWGSVKGRPPKFCSDGCRAEFTQAKYDAYRIQRSRDRAALKLKKQGELF